MNDEKERQEGFIYERSVHFPDYNDILGHYQVLACLEHTQGDSLLDVPCGDGTLTEKFAAHFKRVVGVDASSKHLDVARNRFPHIEFHESLIECYEPESRFDNVVMLGFLEHVADPLVVLQRGASFLKPGGRLIVQVPNENAINRRLAVIMGTLESCSELSPFDLSILGHRRSYSLKSLHKEILDAGLTVTHMGGIFYKMLSTPQMDWFLKNGLWDSGHGWGRTGMESAKDWRYEFCRACYEYGKLNPNDCNMIYACATK